jgi:hypothetical protein
MGSGARLETSEKHTTLTVGKMFGCGVVKVSVEGKADCLFSDDWTIGEALVNIRDRDGLIDGTIESMNGSDWVACLQMLSFVSIIQALLEPNVPCQFRFAHFRTIEQLSQQAGQCFDRSSSLTHLTSLSLSVSPYLSL